MTAAVVTVKKVGDEAGIPLGGGSSGARMHFFDVTADTGTYTTGGFTITAATLKVATIYWAGVGSVATTGTSGATANPIGVIYNASGSQITVQVYESAGSGAPPLEKTSAEAYDANFTFRLVVIGQ